MTAHTTKTWFEDGRLITQVIPESEIYKREWVGLTDEDIDKTMMDHGFDADDQSITEMLKYVEAKLKEKNNG